MAIKKNKHTSILLIDDDQDILKSYSIFLKKSGFNIFTALNSSEALEITKEIKIDIALIDFRLGGENGITAGEMLMNSSKNLTAILFTAYPSFELAVEATKKGFFSFLEKNSSISKVVSVLNEAAGSKKDLNKKVKSKDCMSFITICKHSLIMERIEEITKKNLCFNYAKSFKSVSNIKDSGFQTEIDLVIICASCISGENKDIYFTLKNLFELFPFAKIVISNDKFNDNEKAELIKAGIKGFFSNEMNSAQIEKGLKSIKEGGIWASRDILSRAITTDINYISNLLNEYDDPYDLSKREKEILKTLVYGLKNKEIADRLYISEMTVKTHINRIFKKLVVDSRVKAILKAKEEHLV
ncbi:MAG: response regulator [Acidobacteriota bacterium]